MIKTIVNIEGMMCGHCEAHVNDAIRAHLKVKKVTSSHDKGETVIISEESLGEDAIAKALAETGYQVLGVTEEPYEKRGFFGAR
jgi:copper chaperone